MATIKTSELSGLALDWAVALCENASGHSKYGNPCFDPKTKRVYQTDGLRLIGVNFNPSVNWSRAGPIIERERISVEFGRAEFKTEWIAYKLGLPHEDNPEGGPTPLVAAMRCYVASKMGDNVEIPDSLIVKE